MIASAGISFNFLNFFQSSTSQIYLNVTTLENQELTVELSALGFRIVANCHDEISAREFIDDQTIFETPYALLESVSPAYVREFGKCLAEKLNSLQQD